MIALDEPDRAALAGERGEAVALAMRLLVRYGDALGAPGMLDITAAHLDGCLFHGPSGTAFARRFVDLAGKVAVPTTLNVALIDDIDPSLHVGLGKVIPEQRELTALYVALGCLPTLTCAPYQRLWRPRLGQHLAWAESNAIVFANSVLGARTERYGDLIDLCAAIAGRVPELGLHTSAGRQAGAVFRVADQKHTGLAPELFFGCVGYVLGKRTGDRVPLLQGLGKDTSESDLKALGASAATSGSVALFHAAGITPEAAGLDVRGIAEEHIGTEELRAAASALCPVDIGERVAAVCLGTPHFSLSEFERLVRKLPERNARSAVDILITTSREIAGIVTADPQFAPLESFGVRLVVDTCAYLVPLAIESPGVILTDSVKFAHYGPGNLRRRVGLASLDRCLRSALTGVVSR